MQIDILGAETVRAKQLDSYDSEANVRSLDAYVPM